MVDCPCEQIVVDVANAMGDDISYLSPPSDRNFDAVTLLYGFASGIVLAYGTGILSELGSITAQKIVETCRRYLKSSPEEQQLALKQLSTELEPTRGKLSSVEITIRIEASAPQLLESLKMLGMPQPVAEAKAAELQQVISVGLCKHLGDAK